MKPELKNYGLSFVLGSFLAVSLSSCSLAGKGKYASQWEIQTDVPASLNSGRATVPSGDDAAGVPLRSNLDGLAAVPDMTLDLPVSEKGGIIDIPKPGGPPEILAYQSPPEMLNIPGSETSAELPSPTGSPQSLTTLLAPPPPAVTEEELTLAPGALAAAAATNPVTAPTPDTGSVPAPVGEAGPAPSIPLLYGRLDLAPFLNPPTPLAVNAAPAPAAP